VRTERAGRSGMGGRSSRRPGCRRARRVVLLALSAGGRNHGYTVRAIFDERRERDLRRGGQDRRRQGRHGRSVTATPQAKAAVVLNIENPGFQNFRQDASCTIRPQALIGEKYVDCLPTQPRVEGTPLPPPLNQIPAVTKAKGSTCCPSPARAAPWTSTCSATSAGCPNVSG